MDCRAIAGAIARNDGRTEASALRSRNKFFTVGAVSDRLREGPIKIHSAADAAPVIIKNHSFCFTGRASIKRSDFAELITRFGGTVHKCVTRKTDYLVVGGRGSGRWKYKQYGRKIARARELQSRGYPVYIIPEDAFREEIYYTF